MINSDFFIHIIQKNSSKLAFRSTKNISNYSLNNSWYFVFIFSCCSRARVKRSCLQNKNFPWTWNLARNTNGNVIYRYFNVTKTFANCLEWDDSRFCRKKPAILSMETWSKWRKFSCLEIQETSKSQLRSSSRVHMAFVQGLRSGPNDYSSS